MTRRRWIADEVSGNRAVLIGDHARHLTQVLRAQVGQEFDLSTGAEVRRGKVMSVHPDRVEFELGEAIAQSKQAQITVAISIFKFDRMEWAIEKCTELGVAGIVPVIAGRTEKHLAATAGKRVERWRRLVHQAAEQSRRYSAPDVTEPIQINDLFAMTSETKILLSEVEQEVKLKAVLPPEATSVLLAFGPEGGWTEKEFSAFREAGWRSASLGPTILRAETAVITAVAVIASVLQ
ncbi:MAG TPA: RsmE family RNA methyltransferase [Terriglobales bacterium]|nr:RsmE family RNA methyltransferase [Terriglobales bacterium]